MNSSTSSVRRFFLPTLFSLLVFGLAPATLHQAGAQPKSAAAATPSDSQSVNRLTVNDSITTGDFRLQRGGVLLWPGKLRFGHGGGENSGLPPIAGNVRAQPGGNLVLQPLGDYMRNAIDLLPTAGKAPDLDAIAELTLHRRPPTADTQEMLSLSALAQKQGVYGLIVEAHGEGKLRPLVFMVVHGGLRNPAEGFSAEAMRITEEGTTAFGLHRQGGPLARPVDSIAVEQPPPAQAGHYDSDHVKWVGKSHDGKQVHRADWRANVRVENQAGNSSFALTSSVDEQPRASQLEIHDHGDVEMPTPGAGVILRSPNGKRWRLTVNDAGELNVGPAK